MVKVETLPSPEVIGKKPLAVSWDLDDVTIRREMVTRVGGSLWHKTKTSLKGEAKPLQPIGEIESLDHEPREGALKGIGEKISFDFHSRRKVDTRAGAMMRLFDAIGADQFVNTGRSNKEPWPKMTDATLEKGNVKHLFKDQEFFTPKGSRTAESKADAIRTLMEKYKQVVHIEDDRRTAAYLAEQFPADLYPEFQIYLIDFKSSGLVYPADKLAEYQNIKRIKDVTVLIPEIRKLDPTAKKPA